MPELKFTKAVASGNDFIIIDSYKSRYTTYDIRYTKLAKLLCPRKLSIGADGLLIVERSRKADFKMRVINPDGSEVDMCGNGARCAALYAGKNKIAQAGGMLIETRAGILQASVTKEQVRLKMSDPKELKLKFNIDIAGKEENVNYINTGVPHVVCFVENLDNTDVHNRGKVIRYHQQFQPEGTNANFVQVMDKAHIKVRTYERGVEEETLACGTGSVASAIVAAYQTQKMPEGKFKLNVDTQGGETLKVYFIIQDNAIRDVYLAGKAKIIYQGKILI